MTSSRRVQVSRPARVVTKRHVAPVVTTRRVVAGARAVTKRHVAPVVTKRDVVPVVTKRDVAPVVTKRHCRRRLREHLGHERRRRVGSRSKAARVALLLSEGLCAA